MQGEDIVEGRLEYKFSIQRALKPTDSEYITALKIYNETTPVEIKTNSNELTYWMQRIDPDLPFETMLFVLYLDDAVIGLAMASYLRKTKVAVIEYLAVYNQYRMNAVFFPFINLLQSYLCSNGFDVSYYVNEISNKDRGVDIDKESRLFKKLVCLEGFGKVDAPYITLPLGLTNFESSFDAFLYVKSNDDIHSISLETYMDIIRCLYYDYYYIWYSVFLSDDELLLYKNKVDSCFETIVKGTINTTLCPVEYASCPLMKESKDENRYGPLPANKNKRNNFLPLVLPILLICPVVIIWVYNIILQALNIQISSVGNIIGGFISATITSISAFYISRKRL